MGFPLLLATAVPLAFVVYSPGAHLLPFGIRRGPAHRRAVALTFDDGPDPVWTPRILDVDRAHPGAIIDLHDAPGLGGASARTLTALPSILEGLRRKGYALVSVSTLLDVGP